MSKANSTILKTKKLRKTFPIKKGPAVEAVKGVDLEVKNGEIFGFLGPNGAGKTTTIKMLVTLLSPTGGDAMIVGHDLLKDPQKVRENIGYVSQAGGADTAATALENLSLQAQLYGIKSDPAKKRALELVERFQMSDFAGRPAASYSGGQKRRLDLALGIVHTPPLIFLDEPTLGLDPQSRANFWDEITKIRDEGITIFLTTHYLDEADNLCDRLAIIDHGAIVAEGTPTQLKRNIGGERIVIGLESETSLKMAQEIMNKEKYVSKIYTEGNFLHLYVKEGDKLLVQVLRTLDQKKINVQTIELAKPSLDDVFLQKTGRSLREAKE
jgi:ABC-2 type transport system ATP-binding protein